MKIDRCPHCGGLLPTRTVPKAIEQRISLGVANMTAIKKAARVINPKVSDKQVFNALGMLVRHGRVKRISYGLYEPSN